MASYVIRHAIADSMINIRPSQIEILLIQDTEILFNSSTRENSSNSSSINNSTNTIRTYGTTDTTDFNPSFNYSYSNYSFCDSNHYLYLNYSVIFYNQEENDYDQNAMQANYVIQVNSLLSHTIHSKFETSIQDYAMEYDLEMIFDGLCSNPIVLINLPIVTFTTHSNTEVTSSPTFAPTTVVTAHDVNKESKSHSNQRLKDGELAAIIVVPVLVVLIIIGYFIYRRHRRASALYEHQPISNHEGF
jgi:hypothetical protein